MTRRKIGSTVPLLVLAALLHVPALSLAQDRPAPAGRENGVNGGYCVGASVYAYFLPNPYSYSSPLSAFTGGYQYSLPNPYSFSSPPSAFGGGYQYGLPNPYSFSSPPSAFGGGCQYSLPNPYSFSSPPSAFGGGYW
jgi:hypothetical protein